MKYLRLFEQFIKENANSLLAGDDSKVEIDSVITVKGKEISPQEILGAIISSDTEKEIEQYFYDKYGEGSFSIEAMSAIKKAYNEDPLHLFALTKHNIINNSNKLCTYICW